MSQAKVDRYKAEKANRAKIMKRQKIKKYCMEAGGVAVAALVVAWIGFSAWHAIDSKVTTYELHTSALNDYLTDIDN